MPHSIAKIIFFSKPMIALEILVVMAFGFYVAKAVLEKRAVLADIAAMEADIATLGEEKDGLAELIEYAKTDSFVQEEAREKLNLTAPGESVVVIPGIDSQQPAAGAADQTQSGAILGAANVALWWEYFFDHDELSEQPHALSSGQ